MPDLQTGPGVVFDGDGDSDPAFPSGRLHKGNFDLLEGDLNLMGRPALDMAARDVDRVEWIGRIIEVLRLQAEYRRP